MLKCGILFTQLGYGEEESIASLYQRLAADDGFYRGEESVQAYEAAIRAAEEILPQAFDLLPAPW